MHDKAKDRVFSSVEEYRAFYQATPEKPRSQGSKYYRLGTEIANMATEKAIHSSEASANRPHDEDK